MALSQTKSRYTYRQLSQLSKYSVDTPLRAIAHIDLDAFYNANTAMVVVVHKEKTKRQRSTSAGMKLSVQAQCEVKRLGLDEGEPLAVQQWQSLIAVNYPAREFGVSRHSTAADALKICPNLKLVHVATWQEGDTHWAYRENPNIASCKSCLDPYRNESKKIVSIFRAACPRVEKASIDESFLDLSVMIHERLLARYPSLVLPSHNDHAENLPLPPQDVELGWGGSHLLELDEEWDSVVDWDDVGMAIAAEIVNEIRGMVKEKMGYTCSAGVAQNRMLAKLGSGYKKPNQQTIIRTGAIQRFLNSLKFTKIRNLGGKFGAQISDSFNTEQLVDLLDIPLEKLQSKLDDGAATWVYNVIRGIDRSEVNPRTQIKSMLSAKSFRPTINTSGQAHRWLLILVSDISSRLEEEGVMEGKRRPKTIAMSHKPSGGGGKTRSVPIPLGRPLTKDVLMALAEGLLKGAESEEKAYPCMGLSLQVTGFEERELGNMGIAGFLVKGEQARMANKERVESQQEEDRVAKRRKVDGGIGRFFRKELEDLDADNFDAFESEELQEQDRDMMEIEATMGGASRNEVLGDGSLSAGLSDLPGHHTYTCSRCSAEVPAQDQEEHEDWHFAKSLADEDRAAAREAATAAAAAAAASSPALGNSKKGSRPKKGGGKGPKKGTGMEKGQRKLAFGS